MLSKNTKVLSLALFLVGIMGVFGVRVWQVKKARSIPFSPQESFFSLQPPSEALTGKLIKVEGEVKKEPRDGEEFKEAGKGEKILDGEKLATGEDSQAVVEFPDFAHLALESDSEVTFVNLIPSSFLIKQTSGSINYRLSQNGNPLSVRSLHLLFTLEEGESRITVDEEDGEVVIEQLLGEAKMAMVDLENKTHVWQLKQSQRALVDDEERTVEIEE